MLGFSWVADAVQLGASSFGDRRAVTTFTPFIAFAMSRFGFHNVRSLLGTVRNIDPLSGDRCGERKYYAVPHSRVQVELGRRPCYSIGRHFGHTEISKPPFGPATTFHRLQSGVQPDHFTDGWKMT